VNPALIEVRRARDGAELVYEVDRHRASVLITGGGAIRFPHGLSDAGESLGDAADAEVRAAAKADVARARLAKLIGGRR
jgi:hypothetical protein